MKTGGIILVVVLIVAVLGLGIFLITKNVSQGNANNNPASNTGTNSNAGTGTPSNAGTGAAATAYQLNALASTSDSSEPNDAAATTDTGVVDSSGLS